MTMAILATIFVAGFLTFWYPYAAQLLDLLMEFISNNSSNPVCMFIYGVLERILEVLGLQDTLHQSFWFGTYGGSWTDVNGVTYLGDVNIWTAQIAQDSLAIGTGKYTTAYYLINMVLVPAVGIGLIVQYSNKLQRRKNVPLIVLLVLVSLFSGAVVPLEYLVIIVSPILFFILTIVSGIVYAASAVLRIYIGYNFTGTVHTATPGTLLSFIENIGYLSVENIRNLIILAVAVFLFTILIVIFYYRVLAFEFLDRKKQKMRTKEIIQALGGIDNIRLIDSSPFSFFATVYDGNEVDQDAILALGASSVTETFFYFDIHFGPSSIAIASRIKKLVKDYRDVMKFVDND